MDFVIIFRFKILNFDLNRKKIYKIIGFMLQLYNNKCISNWGIYELLSREQLHK